MATTIDALISVDPHAEFPIRSWAAFRTDKSALPVRAEGTVDLGSHTRLHITAEAARRLADALNTAADNWEAEVA